ncbi:MAG: hypothetical protein JXA42_01350 [Anaerolineales bacterium]|nr:hypothetical protein [Anaerolineales bacterium]
MNDNLLEAVGRSYIVSSLIPAAMFVATGALIFREPFWPMILDTIEANSPIQIGGLGALLSITTLWIGFSLYCGQHWVFKLFEGYLMPHWLARFLTRRKQRWLKKRLRYTHLIDYLKDKQLPPNHEQLYKFVLSKARSELAFLDMIAPPDVEGVLPTAFGNVLRASEWYPYYRYKIKGVAIWPRLAAVLPSSFTTEMEEGNNQLVFLLNSSLLSGVLSIVSGCIAITSWITTHHVPYSIGYFGKSIALFLVGYLFYRMSINVAEQYGYDIRTAYDLYRFKLLSQLQRKIPGELSQEEATWRGLSELFAIGQRLGPLNWDYEEVKPKNGQAKTESD